jgi:predicted RNase H-like HicB family nuclease
MSSKYEDHYVFPAVLEYYTHDIASGISVFFPDLPGCVSGGDNEIEAIQSAREALTLHLYGMAEDGDDIPTPSNVRELQLEKEENCEYRIVFIDAWMTPFQDAMRNKAVKKTLTIPKWLNDMAEKNKVNFSQILQTALKQYLGIKEHKKRA